ncbi:glutathione S-transferase family protein [Rhabdaerophilum sp.]|uniref:glutathione S-transferase family protein n=1 Tax=Rhabdaerophilum sp. TaxID=2717341 RepID=UPI0038D4506E
MIKLHVFGPHFGLLDPSPFVVKAHLLLRMAKLPYETCKADFRKAPKGKFPIIEDDGRIIPDSTLIRFHLETKHGARFDAEISPEGAAIGWAFEKMCEDHLYWALVYDRWMLDVNFDKGPRHFFDDAPAVIRPIIVAMVRRPVRRNLWGQGFGRYDAAERLAIGARGVQALAKRLEDKPFIGGDAPSGADGSVFGTIAALLTDFFASPLHDEARRHPALRAYRDRMIALYFSDEETARLAA